MQPRASLSKLGILKHYAARNLNLSRPLQLPGGRGSQGESVRELVTATRRRVSGTPRGGFRTLAASSAVPTKRTFSRAANRFRLFVFIFRLFSRQRWALFSRSDRLPFEGPDGSSSRQRASRTQRAEKEAWLDRRNQTKLLDGSLPALSTLIFAFKFSTCFKAHWRGLVEIYKT